MISINRQINASIGPFQKRKMNSGFRAQVAAVDEIYAIHLVPLEHQLFDKGRLEKTTIIAKRCKKLANLGYLSALGEEVFDLILAEAPTA